MHICHWTVISETIKGGYHSWIRDSMETAFYITFICTWINGWINNHHADYSMNQGDVKWPSWRLELPANRMFVQQFVQIANKEISKVCVTVPLWWESTVIGGSPHKRRVTWKMLLFDDVIMDWRIPWRHMYHITQYTHCITAINQTMLERGRNVGIPLVSFLSLSSIPKDNKQSLDGGHQYGEVIARLLWSNAAITITLSTFKTDCRIQRWCILQ